ncbi:MAG: hypothetical protein ACKVS6_06870 [Planctomycetota bacterium]
MYKLAKLFVLMCISPALSISCGMHNKSAASTTAKIATVPNLTVLDLTTNTPAHVCETHNVQLIMYDVPIHYGLPIARRSRRVTISKAATSKTPPSYVAKAVSGGCIVRSEKRAIVYACRDCTNLRERGRIVFNETLSLKQSERIFELNTSEKTK